MQLDVFTDGSCSSTDRIGGWAWVLYKDGTKLHAAAGFDLDTTNNRMELIAVLKALTFLKTVPFISARVITDSAYVKDGLLKWVHGWKARGWLTSNNNPVVNEDLWRELYRVFYLELKARVEICWVKGHSGVSGNVEADIEAGEARVYGCTYVSKSTTEVLRTMILHLEDHLRLSEI